MSMSTYVYTVTYIVPSNPGPVVDKADFTASYPVEEGSMLLFKDTGHAVVEAYKSDLVVRVVRTDEPVVPAV